MSDTVARARDLGVVVEGTPGPWNAITDVPGVEVGYATLVSGEGPLVVGEGPVRTGVTAVLPLGRDGVGRSCPAGRHSLNGNGEMTGVSWVDEVGAVSLPIAITNTHAVGPVHRGVLDWSLRTQPSLAGRWHLPVVAETYDGWLNDIDGPHVSTATAAQALDAAASGPVREGSVGGGTGMSCYEFKGGTGTASRRVDVAGREVTVGVLTQANFGRRDELVVRGHRLGKQWADDNPLADAAHAESLGRGAGSCIVLVATDAPLLPGQCEALARRVPLGLARTGTTGSHFSGDLFLAFSTANAGELDSLPPGPPPERLPTLSFLPWGWMDPLFEAVVQATEEAVLNVLAASREMTGRDGHRSPGVPIQELVRLLT